jgi:hypothetical protein
MKNMKQNFIYEKHAATVLLHKWKKETRYQPVRTAHVQAWKNGPYQPKEERTPLLKTFKVLYRLAQLA